MLLKRIAGQLPAHLAAHIPDLEASNVRTTENLLFTPLPTLLNHLPEIPRPELEALIAHALLLTGPQSLTGDLDLDLNLAIREGLHWPGWGIGGLDGLGLTDWDGVGLLEISGGKRVGKSLLAMHVVLRRLLQDPTAICRWIDTEGSFSASRAQAILEAWGQPDIDEVLGRVVVSPCFNIEPSLFDVLGSINDELNSVEPGPSGRRVKMLVIDPISTFFKDDLSHTTSQGHAAMITVMEEIQEMTYSHGLTTIVTNGVISSLPTNELSAFSTTVTRPALGTAFGFCVDISLFVQETGKVFGLLDEEERERVRRAPGLRAVVEVLKSRMSPGGRWAVFETDGVKLFDVVPPPLEDERTIRLSAGLPVGQERPVHGPLAKTMIP